MAWGLGRAGRESLTPWLWLRLPMRFAVLTTDHTYGKTVTLAKSGASRCVMCTVLPVIEPKRNKTFSPLYMPFWFLTGKTPYLEVRGFRLRL